MKKDKYFFSRICYIIEETTAYFISILITGVYLAKLTSELGFSDSFTAILSSFVSLGCSFQLLTLVFFKKGRVKCRVSFLFTLNELLFMLIYLVPFIEIPHTVKAVLFVVFLLGGYFISNIVFAPKTEWFMALIPDHKRGVFTSVKEATSLALGMIFQFCMGVVIDKFEAEGNMRGVFILCGITIFVLTVGHTLSLVLAKEKEPIETENKSVIEEFKDILQNKNIIKVILINILWAVCTSVSTPFFGTYIIKELGFSMTFNALLSMLYSCSRIPCSFFWGKYADKHSFAKMLQFCFLVAAVGFFVMMFTVPSNGYIMYTLYYILFAAAVGGTNSAITNLIFDYAEPEKRRNVLAVQQTLVGIFGFLSTITVTPLVEHIQKSGNKLFGISVYAQQVLSFLSLIILIFLIIYIKKVICKIKKYKPQTDKATI